MTLPNESDSRPDLDELRAEILEGEEFLVVGIILPVKQRFAEFYRAASARQAEDLAGADVRGQVVNGTHGELWVAGVVTHENGKMKMADDYACFVDPDVAPA